MVNSQWPKGRVFPYIAGGPALVYTFCDFSPVKGSQDSTGVGAVAEAGVRYMFTDAISGSAAFRYRYTQPNLDGWRTNANSYGVMLRVAYHF
jgi:opacity protein-like surface antigen